MSNAVDEPLYFPFEIGDKRPLRPLQGYLFKLPRFFVELFPQLWEGGQPIDSLRAESTANTRSKVGADYRKADEEAAVGQRDPFSVDPALVERGIRGHAITQNLLAQFLESCGMVPRSPKADEPNFDLAWLLG